MRTTVSIDDDVYERARRAAFESRRSLGAVMSELLRAGLAAGEPPSPPRALGGLRGAVWVADDFDETPPEVLASVDAPVDPATP